MLTKVLHKIIPTTAALLDVSFLVQLLFVPLAFALSTRPAQAETIPVVEFTYDTQAHEFALAVQPVESATYTVEYDTQETDARYGFTGTEQADEQGRVEVTQAAESVSGTDVITYTVPFGRVTVNATLKGGEGYTYSSPFRIENGQLQLMNAPATPSGYWPQVALDTPYVSPDNDLVSVTFTSLPEQSGDLRIQEVSLTPEQMEELGAPAATAYEITSSLTNGSFTYDLTLPNLTGSKDVQVQYSEDGEEFETANADELTVEELGSSSVVTLQGLDHFTVFVVTGVDNSGSCVGSSVTPSGSDSCYTTLQQAIDAATSGETIDIKTDLTVGTSINITKPLTINGNGHTISPTYTGPGAGNSNNAVIRIVSQSDITINNLIIDGTTGTTLHGFNIFASSNIVLNNVTSKNNDKSGIVNNGSTVTVNNVTTSGNSWHGINVDKGSAPSAGVLTVTGVSSHTDLAHIYVDNTANGSVIDSENQYTSAHINLAGTHPNDLLYTLKGPVKNIATGETFNTIKQAVEDSDTVNGHTIEVKGTLTVTENANVNKDVTIRGATGATINTSGSTQLFTITSDGVTIENLAFVKTDKTGVAGLIGVQANNVTLQNNTFTGQYVLGDGEVARAMVVSPGRTNATIAGNSITGLRQPAYLDPLSTGTISNNYVGGTRGWVVSKDSNFTFTGNTWGTNALDIAIILGYNTPDPTPNVNNYTCQIPAIKAANNNANIQDQHPIVCPDTTAPAAPTITFPNPEQNFTTTPILNDWTDVTDASGISHYRIEYQYDDGHTFSGAPYREVTVSQRNHAPALNEQGGVKIRVQAFDNAGNEGAWSDWRHYYYDAVNPNAPVISGFLNPNLVCGAVTNSATITVDWNDIVDAQSGFKEYQYFIDYPLPAGGRGQWQTTLTSSQYSGGLNEGLHTIKVRAKDKAGNYSAWSNSCDITLDSDAPDAPTNGLPHNTSLNTNTFWFTWSDESDSGSPVTYEFQSSMNPAQSGGVLTTSLWKSGVLPTPTIYSSGAPDGTWYWQVRTIDQAGNTSPWSQIWNVTLDTAAPDVLITAPSAGQTLTDAGSFNITGTITDNLKLLRYYFTIKDEQGDNAVSPLLVNTSSTNVPFSYFWNTSSLEDGEYTIMLEARDAANNKDAGSVHTIKVNVVNTPEPPEEEEEEPQETPAPQPQILGATSSTTSNSSSGTGGTTGAPVCGAPAANIISGLNIATTASGATLTWIKPAGSLTHYALEFVRLDANGNETGRYGVDKFGDTNTTSFTIDNLPGNSSYRFELFAVNDCAPGPRAVASSAVLTAPGAADIGLGEVVLTPNTGEAQVLGAATDEEILEGESPEENNTPEQGLSLMGQVLGVSTENCSVPSWWWILLPAFLAILALLHILLAGRNLVITSLILLAATSFGLHQTLCGPWVWIGATSILTVVSVFLRMRRTR